MNPPLNQSNMVFRRVHCDGVNIIGQTPRYQDPVTGEWHDRLPFRMKDQCKEKEDILDTADRLVNQDRQSCYGHPYDDFTRTASMMSGIGFRFMDPKEGIREIQAKDIPIFMILVKLSREVNTHKEDNLTDTIGYTKTLEMVHEEEQKRADMRLSLKAR